MFQKFYPSYRAESSYTIDYESLYEKGTRGLIYDIDNTLVEHDADANKMACDLMRNLTEIGFSVCFISNNKEPRVKRFYDGLAASFVPMENIYYVYDAKKPSRKNYNKAMNLMGTNRKTTLFIGDQLFTDVYGANRTGIPSVLVKQIAKHEEIQIVLKRLIEKPVLARFAYKRRKRVKESNLILMGFMGCGKSSVGAALAEKLNTVMLDTDALIVEKEGTDINTIFDKKGEEYFRNLETSVLDELLATTRGKVISLGGGTVLRKENRRILRKLGRVVYLKVSPETVVERLKDDTTRPLLRGDNPVEKVRKLLSERKSVYSKASDVTVIVDGKTIEEIVEEILLVM